MIFGILAGIVGIYSVLILIRIILSWFGNMAQGKLVDILESITDPYLNWWRRHLNLRIGVIDFSAVAGIAFLSVVQRVLYIISAYDKITIGIILAVVLSAVWNIVSFVLGFYIIVFILRLIAHFTNRNIFSPFWQIVDSIAQPVLYKINRLFYRNRINYYHIGIIIALVIFILASIAGSIIIPILAGVLAGLPF